MSSQRLSHPIIPLLILLLLVADDRIELPALAKETSVLPLHQSAAYTVTRSHYFLSTSQLSCTPDSLSTGSAHPELNTRYYPHRITLLPVLDRYRLVVSHLQKHLFSIYHFFSNKKAPDFSRATLLGIYEIQEDCALSFSHTTIISRDFGRKLRNFTEIFLLLFSAQCLQLLCAPHIYLFPLLQ